MRRPAPPSACDSSRRISRHRATSRYSSVLSPELSTLCHLTSLLFSHYYFFFSKERGAPRLLETLKRYFHISIQPNSHLLPRWALEGSKVSAFHSLLSHLVLPMPVVPFPVFSQLKSIHCCVFCLKNQRFGSQRLIIHNLPFTNSCILRPFGQSITLTSLT